MRLLIVARVHEVYIDYPYVEATPKLYDEKGNDLEFPVLPNKWSLNLEKDESSDYRLMQRLAYLSKEELDNYIVTDEQKQLFEEHNKSGAKYGLTDIPVIEVYSKELYHRVGLKEYAELCHADSTIVIDA